MSIFGDIKDAGQLEDAVISTLRLYFPVYLAEIDSQRGEDIDLPAPRAYKTVNEFTTFPEDQLPCAIVVSPGTQGAPRAKGDGTVDVSWTVGVAIVNSAADATSTNRNSKRYGAAVRAIILQHGSLGGFASAVALVSEVYEEGPVEQSRTLAVATVEFLVDVAAIVNRGAGPIDAPPDPDPLPGGEWPVVEETDITYDKKDIDEQL